MSKSEEWALALESLLPPHNHFLGDNSFRWTTPEGTWLLRFWQSSGHVEITCDSGATFDTSSYGLGTWTFSSGFTSDVNKIREFLVLVGGLKQ